MYTFFKKISLYRVFFDPQTAHFFRIANKKYNILFKKLN